MPGCVSPKCHCGAVLGHSLFWSYLVPGPVLNSFASLPALQNCSAPAAAGNQQGESSAPPGSTSQDSLFLWLDVVALDQHPCLNSQADISMVRSLAKACSEGADGGDWQEKRGRNIVMQTHALNVITLHVLLPCMVN